MKINHLTTVLVLVFSNLTIAGGGRIDADAVNHEKVKRITEVDDKAIAREWREIEDARDQWDNDNHEDVIWEGFQDFSIEKRSKAQKALEKQQDEERARLLQESEVFILKKIKEYESTSQYAAIIKNFRLEWLIDAKTKQSTWPSDLATKLGVHFDKLGECTIAIHFYQLATYSCQVDGSDADYSCGMLLLRKYNELVKTTRPNAPSAILFSAARQGANYLESGGYVCELGFALSSELKKKRDMMVRWAVSPQLLIKDTYYPENELLEKIYSYGFVDGLLCDIGRFTEIFKAFRFSDSEKEGDLLGALVQHGFYGVKRSYQGNPQYIWVSPKGYLVRVKKSEDKTKWEFTVALTYLNPLEWNGAKAVASKLVSDIAKINGVPFFDDLLSNDELATSQYNEMFKIVVDNDACEQLVMVAPAFRNFYWAGTAMREELLRKAHKQLSYVGKNKKKTIDWTKIDQLCNFKDR